MTMLLRRASAAAAGPLLLAKLDFSQADVLRSDLGALVLTDELERLL